MEYLTESLDDISRLNVIYTILLLASASSLRFHDFAEIYGEFSMDINSTLLLSTQTGLLSYGSTAMATDYGKPSLVVRIVKRLGLITRNFVEYLQIQFNEHTATSIASLSVLVIVISIICCFLISLMKEEERKIKEQYRKLNTGSSQSFIAINNGEQCAYHKVDTSQAHAIGGAPFLALSAGQVSLNHCDRFPKVHLVELRRETYFGLVRLLKPGCRTIVLLCDAQSRSKLLRKFYQCIYPYRKNKTLQFAFLLIEKNIGWYKELLRLALNEKRELQINPLNCVGTVLVLNGFKKYFSVYHASDSRHHLDEPLLLLEQSLLDCFPQWLERLFAAKVSRYYVKYWPTQMR